MNENTQKREKRIHFGWWLYARLHQKFGREKAEIKKATGVTYERLRQYFAWETPDLLTPMRADILEDALGLERGQLYELWRNEPVYEPRRDARGKRGGPTPPKMHLRLALPYDVGRAVLERAMGDGITMEEALIRAAEIWSRMKKSAPTTPPHGAQPEHDSRTARSASRR